MTRRGMLVVLALMGVMVLVVTVSPPPSAVREGAPNGAAPSPVPPRLSDPDAFDVSATLSTHRGAPAEPIEAELGDRVEIVVEGREPDAVTLGEIATRALEAGIPARFELLAEVPGRYPLVLVSENRRIATLQIR